MGFLHLGQGGVIYYFRPEGGNTPFLSFNELLLDGRRLSLYIGDTESVYLFCFKCLDNDRDPISSRGGASERKETQSNWQAVPKAVMNGGYMPG